jgi:RNA polymerase sigma-70 factor (ECF subfamily)
MSSLSPSGAGLESVVASDTSREALGPGTLSAAETIDIGRYAADLKRRALFLTGGDLSRASDLVQDTFEKALLHRHRLIPGSNVRAWLYTIMSHRFQDVLRYERIRQTSEIDEGKVPNPESIALPRWYALTTDQVRAAVEKLNPELRVAFERREFGRLSYGRIAEELGVPVATVGTRLVRARQRLREFLAVHLEGDELEACK